ncbi:hypothetical protein [Sutcliffiella halmapala]|uniref:hypothetical protein n=1 Tax=Sutcliffiella halmapala TaxID=79882 RepID=UPI00099546BC|nr:hypothetical protein [Sutcliffiella halmapala]
MEKRLYYVTLETGKIHREPFDEQVRYFEVEATEEEITELEGLFDELDDTEYSPEPHVPFQDKFGREVRNDQRPLLNEIYTSIYELGTETTKEDIRKMNGLNQRV